MGCVRRLTTAFVLVSGLTAGAVPAGADAAVSNAGTRANYPSVNVALFNGARLPVDALQAFDAVVVDPSSGFAPSAQPLDHTVWVARVTATTAADPAEFVAHEIAPLWARGYRGFLLESKAAIGSFDAVRAAHPDARLLIGGADALAAASPHGNAVYAVVGASLVHGWDDETARSTDISESERARRVAEAQAFMRASGVPVVSLEFCPRTDRECSRATAAQVAATGVTPYVTDQARDVVGIGAIEVVPRKVLVIQDTAPESTLDLSPGVRDLATPLNYLGYDVEYANVNDARLPENVTADRYAGVVAWFEGAGVRDADAWRRWLDARIAGHVPVAVLGQFGFDAAGDDGAKLDLSPVAGPFAGHIDVVSRDPMIGFEIDPGLEARDVAGVKVGAHSRSLLRARAGGETVDQAAITPWGGYALSPYTVVPLNGIDQERWAIQPISFLTAALRLRSIPSPSVTTENGRRLFMVHVDGDGFASRAEFPGAEYSGDALYDRIFTRYRVPMTLSVIEGEVGPAGRYPSISPRLEAIARKMFALPYVEIGSHTYSHPFDWTLVDAKTGTRVDRGGGDTAFSLDIPHYQFNIDREIRGSIDYIDTRLAPPGKKTAVLQWPGNCQPPAIVVQKVVQAGVANINGGDTVITKRANSWTNIAPIGVDKGPGAYQVYAPNQDENVYTNDWLGPFYGFTRVLETYDMTERPLRFKPIDIYFHMYSGTKIASLRALDEIFSAVLKQPVLPVHITDYTDKVLDWRTFAVARSIVPGRDQWVVRGNGAVREVHWPGKDTPDIGRSPGVTGFAPGPDGTYVHIDDGAAVITFDSAARETMPYIEQANGFVRHFVRTAHGMAFEFGGYYQPFIKLADARACRVRVAGKPLAPVGSAGALRFDVPAVEGSHVSYRPVEIDCERGGLQ